MNQNQLAVEKTSLLPRARIMVVEDDPNLLEGIRAILELDKRYTVVTAQDGVQALHYLRTSPVLPDLIVSDIMMPHMDGIEFLTEVRKEQRWVSIPFIFLTAKSDKSDQQRGKMLGVDDYLVKPFDTEDLLIAIESRLQRQKALDKAHENTVATVKRNILTILNHEFRTPLTFVVAYADMLNIEDASELSNEDIITFLKGVGSGATRLRRLIENFILLVELETGDAMRTYEWRRAVIDDVRSIFIEVCERCLLTQWPDRTYEIDLPSDLPPFMGDREYLGIAISQLVSNAFKFSPRERPIRLGAEARDGEIHLWVQDFGRGIPPEEIDSIWETFYQVNRELHEDQGAGSGLAIVRGIADMHKGRVQVKSRVGSGTTFTIILPI